MNEGAAISASGRLFRTQTFAFQRENPLLLRQELKNFDKFSVIS